MGTMHVIHVDGKIQSYLNKEKTTLEEVQKAVGGYIETVPYFEMYEGEKAQAYCDEEGKLKQYPMNDLATKLWYEAYPPMIGHDALCGNIVILTGSAMLD